MNPLSAIRRFAEMHGLAVVIVFGTGWLVGILFIVGLAACIDRL